MVGTGATACHRPIYKCLWRQRSCFSPDNLIWALCISVLLRQKPERLSPCHTASQPKDNAVIPDLICLCSVSKATERKAGLCGWVISAGRGGQEWWPAPHALKEPLPARHIILFKKYLLTFGNKKPNSTNKVLTVWILVY